MTYLHGQAFLSHAVLDSWWYRLAACKWIVHIISWWVISCRLRETFSRLYVYWKLGYSSSPVVSLVPLGGNLQFKMEVLWKLAGCHYNSTVWLDKRANKQTNKTPKPPKPKPPDYYIPNQLFMFVRYINNTVVYSVKLAIMAVQLGGHCSNTWYFTVELHICKPVEFSITSGTVVTWTQSCVLRCLSRQETKWEEKGK